MKFLRKFLNSSYFPVILVLILAILAGRFLIFKGGYFNMHDDLQMMRQLEMEKCFLDKQIPCRWIPDMGYGFGFPLFNFYPPLPYLVGELFRVLGANFVTTAKLTFALSFLVSAVTMYFLAKEFFGKLGGVVSSVFYLWAPYHATDVYVRGAMNEAWALAWFPAILWTSYRLIKEKKKIIPWIIGLSLSWFALFTSHNLMVLVFAPFFAGWLLIFILHEKKWSRLPHLIISGILAFGLAGFFTIPAILEQKYVHVSTLVMGYYEYIAHFATLSQLFISRFWGYGPSIWGDNDGMAFQIGHLHWLSSLVVGALIARNAFEKKRLDLILQVTLYVLAVGWLSAFMAHSRSTFLWQIFDPVIKFLQFPWRFLTITTFSFSFIAGFMVTVVPKKLVNYLGFVLIAGVILINWNYFKPERMGPLSDEEKFSGAAWELQQTAGIFDYLPKGAKENPKEPQRALAEIIEGEGKIISSQQGTNWAKIKLSVDKEALIRIGIFDFPHWLAFIDGKKTEIFIPQEEKWGRIYINVPGGDHEIYLKLNNTPIRTFANILSLATWVGLVIFLTKQFIRRKR